MQRWQRMLGIGWDGDWWSAVVISKSSSQKHEALNPCHLLCCKSKWQQVHRRQQQGNFQKGNGVAGGDHRQLRSRYSSWLTSLQFWSSSWRFAVSPGIWCVVRGETGGALSRVDDNILRRCSGEKKMHQLQNYIFLIFILFQLNALHGQGLPIMIFLTS